MLTLCLQREDLIYAYMYMSLKDEINDGYQTHDWQF